METVFTVGHSTRTYDELVQILKSYGIDALVDVRTIPRSRKNPQFNKDELEIKLPQAGIQYYHAKGLGGLRKPLKDSPNAGWRNESFRGFADYMMTDQFRAAIEWLIDLAQDGKVVLMCAEAVPWRCHRSLIADQLLIRGIDVTEIFDERKSQPHKLTSFAVVQDGVIRYPLSEAEGSGEKSSE